MSYQFLQHLLQIYNKGNHQTSENSNEESTMEGKKEGQCDDSENVNKKNELDSFKQENAEFLE